jgi:hypothetical protein
MLLLEPHAGIAVHGEAARMAAYQALRAAIVAARSVAIAREAADHDFELARFVRIARVNRHAETET